MLEGEFESPEFVGEGEIFVELFVAFVDVVIGDVVAVVVDAGDVVDVARGEDFASMFSFFDFRESIEIELSFKMK